MFDYVEYDDPYGEVIDYAALMAMQDEDIMMQLLLPEPEYPTEEEYEDGSGR